VLMRAFVYLFML